MPDPEHRVLLENDRVRVLDIVIEPGAREPGHKHQAATVMIIDEPGPMVSLGVEAQPLLAGRRGLAGSAVALAGAGVVGAAPAQDRLQPSQHRPRRSRPTTNWACGPVGPIR